MSGTSPTLSRRTTLASCFALGATATASCAPQAADDTTLLRRAEAALSAHAAFVGLADRWGATVHVPAGIRAERGRLWDVANDLRLAAMELPARTVAGLRAKARLVLTTLDLRADATIRPDQDDFAAWSLCRDLIGGAA
ncbi:hypothetical protein GLI01_23220 [Gluconacetobacter liquefaciens]|uniref:Uncharacterized protein n=1 Tax=Gluconacetobacter liquefaciens TaxID=89584 RepID=A0A370G8Y3_GLULI|nr:hypothetical protein [Gluconacetobacter liquefaciens]MBB2184839.1 hypothetical protein [Gluconacetobacter liquefaciens]RDI40262.1 hypothetical protein C7453_10149 [Gluconacetobacter liquefaciens]GBQ96646.1 hypothetical protein AA0522_0819 [Gluconacetobacter liquefaciens NRIC 0522]GEB38287.1 hypothetical protein GLI01_23220 [Gluconacetobacter liquefaciens]